MEPQMSRVGVHERNDPDSHSHLLMGVHELGREGLGGQWTREVVAHVHCGVYDVRCQLSHLQSKQFEYDLLSEGL